MTEISSNNVWAVGSSYNSTGNALLTYTIHYNGASWSIVSSPSPSPTSDDVLYAVTSTRASSGEYEVYAVGVSRGPVSAQYYNSLVLVYISSTACDASPTCNPQWQQGISPNAGNPANNYLYGVTVTSSGTDPGEVWAVGYYVWGSPAYTLTDQLY